MLAPFAALLPRRSGVPYGDLERAAKALRVDPARYQSVDGVEYDLHSPALYRWVITTPDGARTVGLVGVFPLDRLIPHEATTAAAATRPRHSVQIRPVMALIDEPLPPMTDLDVSVRFGTQYAHSLTPVSVGLPVADTAVIADGHHRVAAARRVGGDPGIMTMLVHRGTAVFTAGAFHRVFAVPVRPPLQIPGARLVSESPMESLAAGRVSIATPDGSVGVEIDPSAVTPETRGIPAGMVAQVVLPSLGLREEDAIYLEDTRTALEAAHYGTAILLPGADVASVVKAARTGFMLPPKSTRFRPKPARGFLMRPL
jgi:hypothetical protein